MKTAAVMTRNVVVVSPAVTVGAAAAMMQRLRIRHLPIVEGGHLAGIVSDRDLMRHDDADDLRRGDDAVTGGLFLGRADKLGSRA